MDNMNGFDEEDLIKLHDCLKEINISNRIYKIDDYYIRVLKEIMNKLPTEDQLIIYTFMTHDALLSLISEDDFDDEVYYQQSSS